MSICSNCGRLSDVSLSKIRAVVVQCPCHAVCSPLVNQPVRRVISLLTDRICLFDIPGPTGGEIGVWSQLAARWIGWVL
jgi:hypothetical protein